MLRTGKFKKLGRLHHLYNTETALDMLSHDLLEAIGHCHEAVCIADGESKILLLNPAFESVMGLKNSETIGKRITDLVRQGTSDTAASIKIMESGKAETVLIKTAAGLQVISTGIPMYDQNKRIHRIFCTLRTLEPDNNFQRTPSIASSQSTCVPLIPKAVKETQKDGPLLISRNPTMLKTIAFARHIAQFDSSVLILGESGVGKDLVAQFIHEVSPRRNTGALIKVNCGGIPENLLESELFGYESGAFTGANRHGKAGVLELADKGTLFLDEIGELPLSLQVKLLSVIQDKKFRRLGGTRLVTGDFRLVTATHQDLEKMVQSGRFREDLYYRINVVPLPIIPLRRRPDDIPYLLKHFLHKCNEKFRLAANFAPEVIAQLCQYPWPGNVRELLNLVERLVVTCMEPVVDLSHLPDRYLQRLSMNHTRPRLPKRLKEAIDEFELNLIQEAVFATGTREEAAARLGISLSTLTRRLRKFRVVNSDGQN